jgi:hypothetical protein
MHQKSLDKAEDTQELGGDLTEFSSRFIFNTTLHELP